MKVKIVVTILKWIGIILLAIVLLILLLLFILSKKPFVPKDYTSSVETGGVIEAKYMEVGTHDVEFFEADAPEDWGKFIIHYPAEMKNGGHTYPVVVFVNGTGVCASKYPALFEHLASWGFIVIGNEDPSTCTGDSADATLAYLIQQNENPNSIFYQKVDIEHIGISGHSQGGVGVFNAVNEQTHKERYTCAVSLSPTEWAMAEVLGMHYDPYKTSIPTMILAATENDVITYDGAMGLFDAVNAPKVLALRKNVDHGKMLYCGDGYVTAWFMYWLQGDEGASKAFVGDEAEILNNDLYQDQQVHMDTACVE